MRLVLIGLAVSVAVLIAIPAQASSYVFRDGFWWSNGVPFTRTLVKDDGCGCSYYSYKRAAVAHVTPKVVVNNTVLSPDDPKWQVKMLEELGKLEDKKYFLQALQLSGLAGQHRYGSGNYFGTIQGNSVYGYGLHQQSATVYGDADLNQLFQALERTTVNAQGLAQQAYAGHADVVGRQGYFAGKVAAIKALGLAAQQALADPPSFKVESKTGTFTPEQPATMPRADEVRGGAPSPGLVRDLVLQTSCLTCHNQAKASGGLDVSRGWAALNDAQRASIRVRVTTPDLAKAMPRDSSGKGVPLPLDRQASFFGQ